MNRISRRAVLSAAAAVVPAVRGADAPAAAPLHVATNTYPWGTFAGRRGQAFAVHSDAALEAIAASGLTGYEPGVGSAGELDGLGERLRRHSLEMRSIYVNSTLHDDAQAAASIATVRAIAEKAAALGTKLVVTNPSPLQWGGNQAKTDVQLRTQADALNRLGAALKEQGLMLAYHNHDVELRHGAREFHHMLTATDPALVKFCLDAHWVFRGCGDSQVALFDAVALHGARIVELHLRQSQGGRWTEVFTTAGDIDYLKLGAEIKARGLRPHLVLEQAVEAGSPDTMDAVAAHRAGLPEVRKAFGS